MTGLYKLFAAKGQMFAFLLGILVVAIVIGSALSGLSGAGYDTGTDLNAILKSEGNTQSFDFFNMAVQLPVILVGIILVILVVFSLFQLVTNPKGSMKFLLGGLIVLGLFFIFYSMATPETTGKLGMLHGKFNIGEQASKIISGGIKSTAVLAVLAVGIMVISSVINLFR